MNILLMGLPGAGKGTQSESISRDFPMVHIATGDIFREAIQNQTDLGKQAQSYTDRGDLVPDDITNGLVRERLLQADVQENGFMLDGYPRTLNQTKALEENLASNNMTLDHVIYIDVDAEVLTERLSGRIICRDCGASYHKVFNPPKVEGTCDVCGGHDFYQREDDKPEKVAHRIQLQMDSIRPILEHFQAQGKLHRINGDDEIQAVYARIKSILDA